MAKIFKFFLYFAACLAVFFVLIRVYKNEFRNNQASAFEWEKQVSVYFVDLKKAETSSCEADVPLTRTVPNAETLGPGSLAALLQGLVDKEGAMYYSAINPDVLVQSFEIKNRVAYVDFNSKLNEGVAGSCKLIAIRSQIENTLNNLPDIDSVVISVDGQTEGILEP